MSEASRENRYPPAFQSWLVWGLGAAFYCSGFYQRVAPAVITDHLMADFSMGAAELGSFSAFYFYSYFLMQVPTGILADRWGPRKLLAAGAFVAALGTFFFALGQSIFMANLGRLLIGGSVGVAFVSLLKLSTHWFPPQRFAMTSGLALCFGLVGAVTAGAPLRFLVEQFGWRSVMFVSAVLASALTVAIWVYVRDDPGEKGYKSFVSKSGSDHRSASQIFSGLLTVLRYKNTWVISLAPSGIAGPLLAFSGLWGVSYLIARYGLTHAESAGITSLLLVTWGLGGPVLGGLSDRLRRRKALYLAGLIVSSAGWISIIYLPELSVWAFTVILAIVGFASGSMIIGFAFAKESVPPSLAGTVSGVCNMGVMLGPMILQPLIGWALDRNWTGLTENGIRVYERGAYDWAFALMVVWSVLGSVLMLFSTDTQCRQMVQEAPVQPESKEKAG
ncbi:MAG TPA: MFS transporter [Deltaproteobacteria bacterium]|nr:MFS transporter [Deltaproteobacteria bacterium]